MLIMELRRCYMNYYDEIKDKIINCEIYSKVRDYSRDRNKLQFLENLIFVLKRKGIKETSFEKNRKYM